ncbi:kynureninase [Mangrovivirga sp. M17]|uniref:Kynureninase n=1 Tax=Mangrovivirga halotolerans TaxID=2993936 RepID=A0ABT3RRH8_9BACT|nr:kynureninase [Mangrovivirga halotolerans]MCX2744383.1 kynureninase [Mangrovivirga halotolerans]
MNYEATLEFAQKMDREDALSRFRDEYYIPKVNGQSSIYFCGNSLGLQPKRTEKYLEHEMKQWREMGVEGHFEGDTPWYESHARSKPALSKILGAKEHEIVAMNNLTTNLHLMMVSFYKPEGKRTKIIMEGGAFPSDMYAVESQVKFHGLNPDDHVIEVTPREGEYLIRHEDIIEQIEKHADEISMVLFPGIQYYTGQVFDMKSITEAGHKAGAKVGFDLAHAAGNIVMELHNWNVDCATWCSYKYMNSGPGNVSGLYVHERYADDNELPRFAGWWGHDQDERFQMLKGFKPMHGADGWQLANQNVLALAAHQAALSLFEEAGIKKLREKSVKLTGYLEFMLNGLNDSVDEPIVEIITSSNPEERGCQLSLFVHKGGKELFKKLQEGGLIADWREPNVIRLAPTPMYNSFEDVFRLVNLMEKVFKQF